LAADCPLGQSCFVDKTVQSLTLLPLGTGITRVPVLHFYKTVVVRAVRNFPQFNSVANWLTNLLAVAVFIEDCLQFSHNNILIVVADYFSTHFYVICGLPVHNPSL
jgi:hypothetical protein